MEKLNFPEYTFRMRQQHGKLAIWDPARKKYVALTPEEWVRQHVLQYLILEKGVPPALISVEASLKVYRTMKRYDLVVFDRNRKPLLVTECKASQVTLDQRVIDQVLRYNLTLGARFLLVTNGLKHYMFKKGTEEGEYLPVKNLPAYEDLVRS